jgi:hypothetical protein
MAMRSWLFGSGLWIATLVAPLGQQFTSPSDLVNTLYSSYFDGVEIDDFAPYLSDNLTRKMAGRVGMTQFSALGFDPIVADPHWEPRHFRAVPLKEAADEAKFQVSFETRGVPVSITMTLIQEAMHGWQIDHIAGVAGDRTWCTNDIVALSPAETATPSEN